MGLIFRTLSKGDTAGDRYRRRPSFTLQLERLEHDSIDTVLPSMATLRPGRDMGAI
jgi:hypothetical protein